jgi:lipoprotein NlpD
MALVIVAVAGCSTAIHAPPGPGPGIVHQVRAGETLYRIAKAYGVSARELVHVNDLATPDRLEVGQRLFIPGGKQVLPVTIITPKDAVPDVPTPPDLPRGVGVFVWPLASGIVTSPFGPRGRGFHDGIDITARPGSAVHAACDGVVLYADVLRGYGNVVIVQHAGGYATVYAHNEENLVHAGDHVHQGDTIARLGRSGRTSEPSLHFEIRKDNIARNPIYFLPGQTPVLETAQHAKDKPT